ncbi:DUF192 domain-containing protein [Candidatus Micrarchaeota archaeon]|jgi:uncharacterized membrane protein (UPF0127 family)|nr:DUF192 domain-containing protein [Candidatus Micrarchaeota archaeon]
MTIKIFNDIFEVADNMFSRARGLMFRKKIIHIFFIFENEGKTPIHSFFVFKEFEAVYLNSKSKVVDIFSVKPFTFWVENTAPAKYLIEAPIGWCKKNKIKKGSFIKVN